MKRIPIHRAALIAAIALAAGAAQAQSSVTLSGLLDVSAGQSKAAGSTSRVWGVDNGNMTTSWFGASGSEDLGGGLSALFTLQSFMRADTGASGRFGVDTFWARNAFVGLASKDFGKVTLGRNTTPFFVTTLSFNPFGDSFGYSPSIRHYFTSGTLTGDLPLAVLPFFEADTRSWGMAWSSGDTPYTLKLQATQDGYAHLLTLQRGAVYLHPLTQYPLGVRTTTLRGAAPSFDVSMDPALARHPLPLMRGRG